MKLSMRCLIIALSVVMLLPTIALRAQNNSQPKECLSHRSYSGFLESYLTEIADARKPLIAANLDLQRIRSEIALDRRAEFELIEDSDVVMGLFNEATKGYNTVTRELGAKVAAAGGTSKSVGGGYQDTGVVIPPKVSFHGLNFKAENERLRQIYAYVEEFADDLAGFDLTDQYLSEELARLALAEKNKLDEIVVLTEKLNMIRKRLEFAARACEDQNEDTIVEALAPFVPENRNAEPEPEAPNTGEIGGLLENDPYWEELIHDKPKLKPLSIGEVDKGAYAPDDGWDDAANGDNTQLEEGDFGIPGNDDPVVWRSGQVDVVSPSEDGTGGPVAPASANSTDAGNANSLGAHQPLEPLDNVGRMKPVPIPSTLGTVNMEAAISPEARRLQALIDAAGIDPSSYVSDIKACGWDATLICARLSEAPGPDRSACKSTVDDVIAQCSAAQSRHGSGLSVARCQADCGAQASDLRAGLHLYQLARKLVQSFESPLARRLLRLKVEREQLLTRRVQLQSAVENRLLHIYINSETNAMIVHDGPYFQPQPPLVYSGTSRRPATHEQVAVRAELSQQLNQLALTLDGMRAQIAGNDDEGWRRAALSHWDAIIDLGGTNSCLNVAEVETSLSQCRADCVAQGEPNLAIGWHGPIATDSYFCSHSSANLGMLMADDTRRWLLPPSVRPAD